MSGNSSSSDRQAVSVPPQWEAAADSVAYDSSSDPPPVIVVCGPGNSGKSLFSRTLLNTLLKRYKKVGYLDTDVGQPEFNTPGCVSLHIIDKPTPDLTILCLKTPEKCFFYGDVNCQKDKNVYLNSILSLYDYFHEEFYQPNEINDPGRKMMPLVVNTSGWVKGAGYDLLVKMLRHISPTHVVQIRVSAESKNLPKGLFWLDENQQRSSNSIEICAAVKDSSSVSMRKDAAHVLRDVRIIAYFRQCLPRELAIATYKDLVRNLASAPAHEISLSRIRVIELHCEGNDNISHSWKAKIVGLGISTSVPASSENASPNCVGLGFVRAEDVSKDLMYVITPVPLRILEKVDIILKGCLEAPACLLQVQEMDATDS